MSRTPVKITAADETAASQDDEDSTSSSKICGIVMPIAAMDEDYTAEHWKRVRKILEHAVIRAKLRPQLVWESPDIDVIQSKILQNLYENDVIICDVSALNPNVMLETGLRLSTKRPTIIVTDRVKSPPFDIGTIGYIEYQRDLEYNAIEEFISRLAKKIQEVVVASEKGSYLSFVENYRFETVSPSTVTVSSEEFLRERIDELSGMVRRMERITSNRDGRKRNRTESKPDLTVQLIADFDEKHALRAESELDDLDDFHVCSVTPHGENEFLFSIRPFESSKLSKAAATKIVYEILEKWENVYNLQK
jgi:hypothetical protein